MSTCAVVTSGSHLRLLGFPSRSGPMFGVQVGARNTGSRSRSLSLVRYLVVSLFLRGALHSLLLLSNLNVIWYALSPSASTPTTPPKPKTGQPNPHLVFVVGRGQAGPSSSSSPHSSTPSSHDQTTPDPRPPEPQAPRQDSQYPFSTPVCSNPRLSLYKLIAGLLDSRTWRVIWWAL